MYGIGAYGQFAYGQFSAVQSFKVTAESGAFTLTGQSAALPTSIVANAGSFTLSGQTAALKAKITAAAGSFTLTGKSAALPVVMPAASGAFVFTGINAALTPKIAAGAGSFVFTGQAMTMQATRYMAASSLPLGKATQTGVAAFGELAFGQLFTQPGITFALSFQTFRTVVTLPVGAGSFTFTGNDANVFLGKIINADVGTFTISGQTAVLRTYLNAETGTFTVGPDVIQFARRRAKIMAFPRVGHAGFSASSRGRDGIKIRAFGG